MMFRLTIFALFVITPVTVSAQHNAGGCASVEGQKLKFLLGEWKVTSKFRVSKEPERWEETQARITGQTVLLRRVWTQRPAGGFEALSQRSTDAGRTWDTTWQMIYQR